MNNTENIYNLPELITVTEMRKYLHISTQKAYELARDRNFPSVKIGKNLYISVPGLNQWLEKEMRKPKY